MKQKEMAALRMCVLAIFIAFLGINNPVAAIPTCHICTSPYPAPGPSAEPPVVPAPVPGAEPPDSGSETPDIFDVTHHGANGDGETDNSMAFSATWEAACSNTRNSTFFVPEGKYLVGPILFTGPCNSFQPPLVKIEGTLIALPKLDYFPNSTWIEFRNLNRITLTGVVGVTAFDGQGEVEAWKQISCRNSAGCDHLITSLVFSNVSYGTISNITLLNSKGFHVGLHGSNNINIQDIEIIAPWDSPNTDGIHVSSSTNITITSSKIGVGDDCVSIGPGSFGISVSDVHCGPGHGISVGSLGKYPHEEDVIGINVENCTINGTQNGVRVKTWPGSPPSNASDMTFQDIVMINVSNPIIIDQQYCPSNSCDKSKSSLVKLSNIYVKNISGTYNTESAVTLLCSSVAPCENIRVADINLIYTMTSRFDQSRLNMKGAVNGFQVLSSSF